MTGPPDLRRPVLIGGPTASGKSALAVEVAARDGGVVVNADALQVYRRWKVLTARPSRAEEAQVEHALYGHVANDARYSVGTWLGEVAEVLREAARRGLRPVVVGGTGLYLSKLTEGLAGIPPVPAEVRRAAEARLAEDGVEGLGAALARRDPESWARIDRRNPARVLRAWEVLEATGRGLADWQRGPARPLLSPGEVDRIVISPAPEVLKRRIAARMRAMVEHGALDECRAAIAAGWDPRLPSARALGAAELVAHLRGEIDLETAIARATVATRQFAKRQRTWLRGRMADWSWYDPDPAGTVSLLDRVARA